MPLNTRIIRDGEPLTIRWGDFHVAAMAIAASLDGPDGGVFADNYTVDNPPAFRYKEPKPEDIEKLPEHLRELVGKDQTGYPDVPMPLMRDEIWNIAMYPMLAKTPLNGGSFTLTNRHRFYDPMDGEIFELLPGDELVAYRSSM